MSEGLKLVKHPVDLTSSVILIIFGFVQMSLAAAVVEIVPDTSAGAWWLGVLCIFSGTMGLVNSECTRGINYVASIFIVLSALVVLVNTGSARFLARSLDTCAARDGSIYGVSSASLVTAVAECRADYPNPDCECISSSDSVGDDVLGFDTNPLDECFGFYLTHDTNNCEQVLVAFPDACVRLETCMWFMFLYVCYYSFLLCGRVCGCCRIPTPIPATSSAGLAPGGDLQMQQVPQPVTVIVQGHPGHQPYHQQPQQQQMYNVPPPGHAINGAYGGSVYAPQPQGMPQQGYGVPGQPYGAQIQGHPVVALAVPMTQIPNSNQAYYQPQVPSAPAVSGAAYSRSFDPSLNKI
jgi:hypothetical protein